MPITKGNVQETDQQAQEVVNTWALTWQSIAQGKIGASLRDDFEALFKLGLQYRSARTLADNRRECDIQDKQALATEEAAWHAFTDSYKAFLKKHRIAANHF